MKQVIFIESTEIKQTLKVNTILKYFFAREILLFILIFNKDFAVATKFYLMNQILTLVARSFYS